MNMVELIVMILVAGIGTTMAIFGLLAVGVSAMNYKETPARDRLMALKGKADSLQTVKQKGPFDDLKEVVETFSGKVSKDMYGKDAKYLQGVKKMLTAAGLPDSETHVWKFLRLRVVVGLSLGGGLFALSWIFTQTLTINIMLLIGGFLAGSFAQQFLLRVRAQKRQTEIRYTLPDVLDLMVVCVEAGLGLDATINRVGREAEFMAPDLSHEFRRLTRELNAGLPRLEAFQNLGSRSGLEELRSLCALIIQTDKLGTSIGDTLRIYADDMRVKRRQRAEEMASKASIKMTFPLVFFIFPPLGIVLMGPMVITALKTFNMGN